MGRVNPDEMEVLLVGHSSVQANGVYPLLNGVTFPLKDRSRWHRVPFTTTVNPMILLRQPGL